MTETLTRLQRLDLEGNRISDNGVRLLAQSPLARQLVSLDLSRNDIGPAGAQSLFQSTLFNGLRRLRLSFDEVSPWQVAALRDRFGSAVVFE